MAEKKKSFADCVGEIEVRKNNSDLQNLAHALLKAKTARDRVEALMSDITDAAHAIEEGEDVDLTVVKDLFDKASKLASI